MIIGVVSDTHSLLLPPALLSALKSVDLIVHAGDICDADVLQMLGALAPVKAVQGNMDEPGLKKKLPLREVFAVEGVTIGVAHGHMGTGNALANIQTIFADAPPQLVVFGHSHQPLIKQIGPTLFFNPGSPNDAVRAPYFSYGVIGVKNGKIKAEIKRI